MRYVDVLKEHWRWLWAHRTKAIGTVGTVAGYAALNQDKLGLVLPVGVLSKVMMAIGGLTFAIGLYNQFLLKHDVPKPPTS